MRIALGLVSWRVAVMQRFRDQELTGRSRQGRAGSSGFCGISAMAGRAIAEIDDSSPFDRAGIFCLPASNG
jgi:hypothetical protein